MVYCLFVRLNINFVIGLADPGLDFVLSGMLSILHSTTCSWVMDGLFKWFVLPSQQNIAHGCQNVVVSALKGLPVRASEVFMSICHLYDFFMYENGGISTVSTSK